MKRKLKDKFFRSSHFQDRNPFWVTFLVSKIISTQNFYCLSSATSYGHVQIEVCFHSNFLTLLEGTTSFRKLLIAVQYPGCEQVSSGESSKIMRKETQISDALWSPKAKLLKTSFSGGTTLSSSFCPNANLNHPLFFFGLVLAASHSSTISLEGMTLSRKPLSIRIGKEDGIPAILDAENHF